LEAKGIGAKCAAAMGNNCQDDYSKLYPARMFLDAIGFPMTTPTDLYQDNQSTIKLLENSTNGARTKHIAIRFQLIKEYIKRRMLRPVYLRTEDMVPDLINKLHGPTGTRHLRALLLGYNNGIDPTKWIPPEQLL
jgi:hypothetical protein